MCPGYNRRPTDLAGKWLLKRRVCVCLFPARLGSGLSYGTAGNSATIHGSPGLFRRDQGGYFGGSRPSSRSRYSSYGGYSPSSGSADEVQKETKYYYGGKYQGDSDTTVKYIVRSKATVWR